MATDELPVDARSVARLLQAQAPEWADRPVVRLASTGTDNAIFRLGEDLLVRLPRQQSAVALLKKELDWLPHLRGLPLDIPALRFRGKTDGGLDFGIFDWMAGEIASAERLADPGESARRLADFLHALHLNDTTGAPVAGAENHRRGAMLDNLTPLTIRAIDILRDEVDSPRALALWNDACAHRFEGPAVWLHGDLKADNLIARGGVLRGVIDWGLAAVGDPAADYASAWSWVDPRARNVFRDSLNLSEADWLRAQGWALYGAVIALSYYRGGKNEALTSQSRQTLSRLTLLR
ncbi:phosphotransferase [Haematobacter massiliensis]|uniref:Phosphotransferase n=1 Tax=Haematobacter massiliensis TaxID=195105 RepID=A0A086Y284_9RHOB|nr:aminoglycoside phosphotransferase family protein [Haematobacter massiliensis]KFI28384.1 phosphotransferase [Haematobacter massiliensis]OWJ84676.1 aminoglycoside phosphotransferase [Haematobacter massiliensis]QBJ26358.1 aminoglycoside phosphotransferase family protein [Haematobacter massiliensis]